ncbi:MAG: methanogenesis marker 12 protein [Archaeoglobi archaeon]|nr:methanogenesis marker 12 protein [Candidatus Mnemosynella sp.]
MRENVFAGIDHGTRALRIATTDGRREEFSRERLAEMTVEEIREMIREKYSDVRLFALSYSMGDAINEFTDIRRVSQPVKDLRGAGEFKGGGTKFFEAMREFPCVLIPGIHRGNYQDWRFGVFSHGASPDKVGVAHYALKYGKNLIVSDCSSNTVTLAMIDGRIRGAIDACIFSPGLLQGPIDLEAIRRIDSHEISATQAFSEGGVRKIFSEERALEVLALFCAMEIESMKVLMREAGVQNYGICLAGELSENREFLKRVEVLLNSEVIPLGKWSSAEGCAEIAEEIYRGRKEILGLRVNF